MQLCLFSMLLNQSITDLVLFHWFNSKIILSSELKSSGMILLIFSNSLFKGFINLHVGFDLKSSLWSFSIMKAWVFARQLIWSSRSRFSVIFLASKLISWSRFFGAFLYVLVMYSLSSSLCSSGLHSYMLPVLSARMKTLYEDFIFLLSLFRFLWNSSVFSLNFIFLCPLGLS